MKKIKFRGKDIQTGKFIYGDLIHSHSEKGGVLISEERPISTPARWVEYDSVAQLVGYDKDGNEIYEGDTVTNVDYDITASYSLCVVDDYDEIVSDVGVAFPYVKLVKEN